MSESRIIVDPTDPREAILAPSGRLAARVHMGTIPNPQAPTVRDLQALRFIGHGDFEEGADV